MIRILIAAAALALAACATAAPKDQSPASATIADAEARRLIAGTWHGSYADPELGDVRFLSRRRANGTYVVEFRFQREPAELERGEWGVEDGLFWTLFQEWTLPMFESGPDAEWFPAEPPVRDAYRILNLTDAVFEYEHVETGVRFEAKRVADGFSMPSE